MTVPRVARAVSAVLVTICGVALAVPATVGRAQTPEVSLSLLQQTPWTTNEAPNLTVRVVATNTGPTPLQDLSIGLTIGPAIRARDQYEEMLAFGPSSTAFAATYPVEGELTPGTARTAGFTQDLSTIVAIDPTDSGVYPATVDIRAGGNVLASLNTPLIHIVQEPVAPVRIAWWIELTAPVVFAPDGRLADPGFELSLAPDGSLYEPVAQLQLLQESVPEEIDLAVQPMLLYQARQMADGYERTSGQTVERGTGGAASASGFLDVLQEAAAFESVQVSAQPFSGPSIPAMLGSGLSLELNRQRSSGDQLTEDVLGVLPEITVARPPEGLMNDSALGYLTTQNVGTVLADADEVERATGTLGFAPPPTTTITTENGTTTLVLPNPSTQALLARPDLLVDPVRAAQVVLGELAVVWKEQPNPPDQPDGSETVRGLALALTSELPPTIWGPLLRRLAGAPFLEPEHAQDLVASVNPPGEPASLAAPDEATFTSAYAERIQILQHEVDAYASMLTDGESEAAILHRDVMIAESAEYLGNENAGAAWLDAVSAVTDAAFASTTPTVNQVFTFTSGEGSIPLRMGDPGDIPLQVTVELTSSQFEFPDGNRQDVVLDQPNEIVTFRVVAKGSGRKTMQVEVFAPSGRRISRQTITVQSTALNSIALLVTAGAAALLIVLYARRWVRRRASPS
ncbi:MAG TPA: hypothetical protein VIB62_07995 [Actinomycetota bacterium]